MNAPLDPQSLLLARLAALADDAANRQTPLPCLAVRAACTHSIRSAAMDAPGLAIPLRGTKRMKGAGDWFEVQPGQVLLLGQPATVDAQHLLPPDGSRYLGLGVSFPEPVLQAARTLWQKPPSAPQQPLAQLQPLPLAPLVPALAHWADALDSGRASALRLALTGLVLQLCELGLDGLLQPTEPTLAARIRAMVAARPARDWRSQELELSLGLSGATLRRRLASEGTSLRQLIADARLAHALELLYATRLPVKTVAQRVGYASASSFVKRFGERYGIEPSRIGEAALG